MVPEVPLHSHFALSPQVMKGPFGHLREHVSYDRIVGVAEWGRGSPWEPPALGPSPRSRSLGATRFLEACLVVCVMLLPVVKVMPGPLSVRGSPSLEGEVVHLGPSSLASGAPSL